MAKSKKKASAENIQEAIEDLAEMAGKRCLPEGALDGELEDCCELEKRLALERVKESVLLDQLEYLYAHGYELGRLRELVEEAIRNK